MTSQPDAYRELFQMRALTTRLTPSLALSLGNVDVTLFLVASASSSQPVTIQAGDPISYSLRITTYGSIWGLGIALQLFMTAWSFYRASLFAERIGADLDYFIAVYGYLSDVITRLSTRMKGYINSWNCQNTIFLMSLAYWLDKYIAMANRLKGITVT